MNCRVSASELAPSLALVIIAVTIWSRAASMALAVVIFVFSKLSHDATSSRSNAGRGRVKGSSGPWRPAAGQVRPGQVVRRLSTVIASDGLLGPVAVRAHHPLERSHCDADDVRALRER